MEFDSAPTLIHQLKYKKNNNKIFLKREDLLPISFGGNKVRIAYKYFEDMERQNCNCIIAYGNARSNLCRVIANISKSKGIECYVISPADDSGEHLVTSNSKIVKKSGATIVECFKSEVPQTITKVIAECKERGLNPYYIYGDVYGQGNEKVPVHAYREVYDEIKKQEIDLGFDFDYIFLACGTGTTMAGLICGSLINNSQDTNIIGFSIAREKKIAINHVSNYINRYFGGNTDAEIKIEDAWTLGGYGKYNNDVIKAIRELLLNEGVPFDPTYTGKAFWAMQQYIDEKQINDKKILFLHTGGTPLFFDNINLL